LFDQKFALIIDAEARQFIVERVALLEYLLRNPSTIISKVGGDVGIVPSSSDKNQVRLVMLNLQLKMESGSGNTGVH